MAKQSKEVEDIVLEEPRLEISKESFKYLCPACTNEAFYIHKGSPVYGGTSVTCSHCGKTTEFDETRLVRLA